jgi:translation initiation factor IF-3
MLNRIATDLADLAEVEQAPRPEGRTLLMLLNPINTAK